MNLASVQPCFPESFSRCISVHLTLVIGLDGKDGKLLNVDPIDEKRPELKDEQAYNLKRASDLRGGLEG